MSDQKQSPQNSQVHSEETTASESTLSEETVDKVKLRVEGQNENITTPPEPIQSDIAATARDLQDTTMGIEDESS